MRTSLNEIRLIDDHLFNKGTTEETLLFDAMLIINPMLNEQVALQKKAHSMVQQYGRKKLKAEIEAVHRQLFAKPAHRGFREKILSLFFRQ
jgi:hypothetical protein